MGTLAAMKPKLRARRMWANYYPEATICTPTKRLALIRSDPSRPNRAIPVAVIPLHDPEALVAKAKTAYVDACHMHVTVQGRVKYMLTAIGVLPKSKGGRK